MYTTHKLWNHCAKIIYKLIFFLWEIFIKFITEIQRHQTNQIILHETKSFNEDESILKIWCHSKKKTYAWDPITGIYLERLKSSTCKFFFFFSKTRAIDGSSHSIRGQDLIALEPPPTLCLSNYSGIKTLSKLRSSEQTTNAEGEPSLLE